MKLEIYRSERKEFNMIGACAYVECAKPVTAIRRLAKAVRESKRLNDNERYALLSWLDDEEGFIDTLAGWSNDGKHADAGKDEDYCWSIDLEKVEDGYWYVSVSTFIEKGHEPITTEEIVNAMAKFANVEESTKEDDDEEEEGEETETPSTETVEIVDEINNEWNGYDKAVAKVQLESFGKIYLDEYGKPIDDLQYVEQELYNNDNDIEEYEINNKYQVEALRFKNGNENEIIDNWVIEELNKYKEAIEDAKKCASGECKLMGYDAVVVNAYDKEYDIWEEVESYKIE